VSDEKTTKDWFALLKKALLISNMKSNGIEIPAVISADREQGAYKCGYLQAEIDVWRCIAEVLEFEFVEKAGGS